LFRFGDLDPIEEAIRSAAADPEKLKRDYSNAREAVAERFSQPAVWRRYAEVYLEDAPAPDAVPPAAAAERV
jgi:hypothetical protein